MGNIVCTILCVLGPNFAILNLGVHRAPVRVFIHGAQKQQSQCADCVKDRDPPPLSTGKRGQQSAMSPKKEAFKEAFKKFWLSLIYLSTFTHLFFNTVIVFIIAQSIATLGVFNAYKTK